MFMVSGIFISEFYENKHHKAHARPGKLTAGVNFTANRLKLD